MMASKKGINTVREPIIPEIFSEFIFFPSNPLKRNPISGKSGIKMKYLAIIGDFYHFKIFISSMFNVSLFLYNDITIAKPTAASAAATAITKKTKICPVAFPRNAENDTNERLMEFNINSIDIKIIIALRLTRTPIIPIVNRIALNIRK